MQAKDVRLLKQKRKLLAKRMAGFEQFVRGSVVLMKRRCVYRRCRRCASGAGHPTWVLTVSQKGKTRTVYLGRRRLADARRMAVNYRMLQAIVEQIAQVNLELLRYDSSGMKGAGRGRKGQGP